MKLRPICYALSFALALSACGDADNASRSAPPTSPAAPTAVPAGDPATSALAASSPEFIFADEQFDIRAFHAEVLRDGKIDRWIAAQ